MWTKSIQHWISLHGCICCRRSSILHLHFTEVNIVRTGSHRRRFSFHSSRFTWTCDNYYEEPPSWPWSLSRHSLLYWFVPIYQSRTRALPQQLLQLTFFCAFPLNKLIACYRRKFIIKSVGTGNQVIVGKRTYEYKLQIDLLRNNKWILISVLVTW